MPRVTWPLWHGRPSVQIVLTLTASGQPFPRTLLADTGAGSRKASFDLILAANDCLLCSGLVGQFMNLRGAYTGSFPVYNLRVQVPALAFDSHVKAVGASSFPTGFDGIAGFGFLNRFTYGNFGNPNLFGLEC
jgi:hypothetical protein